MKSKIKKLSCLVLPMIIAMVIGITSFASEPINIMHNVSTEAPKEVITYGLDKPSTSEYVDLNNGKLTFSGKADVSTLYTNKHFTGKSTIGYSIINYSDTKLTVKFYTSNGWFKSKKITIEGNATLTGTISGLDADKLYFLTFSAPSNFSGSIY